MSLPTILLVAVALAAAAAAAWACRRAEQLSRILGDVDVVLGAVRERVGVTDGDVDAFHDRVHPDCVPKPAWPRRGGR